MVALALQVVLVGLVPVWAAPGLVLVLGEVDAPVAQAARAVGVALDRGAVAARRAAMGWTARWRLKLAGQGSPRCPAGSP